MPKIFTIVKDEVDIVEDWIIYHGSMFGWKNIFVIDNDSLDGTWEKLEEYKHLINISREPDYLKKGQYMKNLIDTFCQEGEIAFPVDIDEFIVHYDHENNVISIDKPLILNYMSNLPKAYIYKANYINALLTKTDGYEKATYEITHGLYSDYGNLAKSFFNTKYYKGPIDHGNHIQSDNYHLSNICLVHYHARNLEQMKKKILNNVVGLGHKNELTYLKRLIESSPLCAGHHHVKNHINVLEGNYALSIHTINNTEIDLNPLKNRIIGKIF